MNIKSLYTFSVNIEKEVEKIEKIEKDGQTIETKTKLKEPVPVRFSLKKPSRTELDEIRFHYASEYNKAITEGFLTKGMMVNKYANNTGGIFSQNEAKQLLQLFAKRETLDLELKQAASISAPKETQDDLSAQLLAVSRQILEIELSNQTLFQYTAENKAKEQTVAYMFYYLTYTEKNGTMVPYFEGKNFAEKKANHYKLEDSEDTLLLLVRDRLINLFAHYYEGVASTEEDFKRVEDSLSKQFDVVDYTKGSEPNA